MTYLSLRSLARLVPLASLLLPAAARADNATSSKTIYVVEQHPYQSRLLRIPLGGTSQATTVFPGGEPLHGVAFTHSGYLVVSRSGVAASFVSLIAPASGK
ncbi:MAG: hypothetical protein EOO75_20185, partial [Myxococcales bacterium]